MHKSRLSDLFCSKKHESMIEYIILYAGVCKEGGFGPEKHMKLPESLQKTAEENGSKKEKG